MLKKKINICIVTVHKGNLDNLKKTIKSIDNQIFEPVIHIVVANKTFKYQINFLKNNNRIFILNKDYSIYNAMNRGKTLAKNIPILFLNSGDIFYKKNTLYKIRNIISILKLNYVAIFTTLLKYHNIYFQIKKSIFAKKRYIPHSSFISMSNRNNNKLRFDEKIIIVADGLWMNAIIKKSRKVIKFFENLTVQSLGGISTRPTINTVVYQFNYKILSGIKEFIKFLIFRILSSNIYYQLIFKRDYKQKQRSSL
jgi:hypothetical protein